MPLPPDDPWKTTSQEESHMSKPFKYFAQRLIKETSHHRKGFMRSEIPFFDNELPNDVGNVLLFVLSKWTSLKLVLHRFHRLRDTMGTTFVNLHQDFTTPLVDHDCLIDERPKEGRLFLCLSFVPDDIPSWGGRGELSFHHLYKSGF